MPVDARRLIRKMRGGAQAHLIEAADGHSYVVKFVNNPQHRRVLVNDWIGSAFLRYLGLSSPEPAMVNLSPEFIAATPDLHMQLGSQRIRPEPGWHFGSRFPGDPLRTVVYDYLPDVLLESTANRAEFAGVLAFDQWTGNADSRQAVFFRARLKEWLPSVVQEKNVQAKNAQEKTAPEKPAVSENVERNISRRGPFTKDPNRLGFVAQMIDNGFLFDGPHWRFGDTPLRGLFHRPIIYKGVRSAANFDPWLERIVHFPEEIVDQTVKQIPPAWISGDEEALDKMLAQLLRRKNRVPDLIEACRAARPGTFPDWP